MKGPASRSNLTVLLMVAVFAPAWAGGPLLIDHPVNEDTSGIWNPNVYRGLLKAMTVGQIGLALWDGGDSRLGNTAWRGIDSEIIGAVSTDVLKRTFTRTRPRDSDDPNGFFAGDSNRSFPEWRGGRSGLDRYRRICLSTAKSIQRSTPSASFPLYVGIGRIKAQAHWQERRGGRLGRWEDSQAGTRMSAISRWFCN
jgi:undecaprenyl-diphosphatase